MRRRWGVVEFYSASQDIHEPTEWRVDADRHTFKVLRSGTVRDYAGGVVGGPQGPCLFQEGDVSLLPAGCAYRSRGRGVRIDFSVVSFSDPDTVRPVVGGRDAFAHQTVLRMHEAVAAGEETLGEALAWSLLLHLKSRYLEPAPAGAGLSAVQKRRLDDYLRASLGTRPTVARLAREVGLGRSQFVVAFRAAYGTTPAQHVMETRLAAARLRLSAGGADIAEIAHELGFSSHAHLTAAFRRRYGLAPREVRSPSRLI